MSNLFAQRENGRFMDQMGVPVYEYYEPSFLKRAYRTAVDVMWNPEYLAPTVASLAAGAAAGLGMESLMANNATPFLNGSSTFVFSWLSGMAAPMFNEQMLFNFQRPLGIVHSYFDKKPEKDDIDAGDQKAARKMKQLHRVFGAVAAIAVGAAAYLSYKAGGFIAPDFWGAAIGITISPVVMQSRYAKVERGDWAFHYFGGGPPRGRKMPEEDWIGEEHTALSPVRVNTQEPRRIL